MKAKRGSYIKVLDVVIVAAVIVLSCFSLLFFFDDGGDYVTVMEHGEIIYEGKLLKDMTITTSSGKNTITIKDGEAFMSHAECNDKTCINMGKASASRPVVCLPNEVMIIISSEKSGLDDITY